MIYTEGQLYNIGSNNYLKRAVEETNTKIMPPVNFLYSTRQPYNIILNRYFPNKFIQQPTNGVGTNSAVDYFSNKEISSAYCGFIGNLHLFTELYGGPSGNIENMDAMQFVMDLFSGIDRSATDSIKTSSRVAEPSVTSVTEKRNYYHGWVWTDGYPIGNVDDTIEKFAYYDFKNTSLLHNFAYIDLNLGYSTVYKDRNMGYVNFYVYSYSGRSFVHLCFTPVLAQSSYSYAIPYRVGSSNIHDFPHNVAVIILGENDEYLGSYVWAVPYTSMHFNPPSNSHTTQGAVEFKQKLSEIISKNGWSSTYHKLLLPSMIINGNDTGWRNDLLNNYNIYNYIYSARSYTGNIYARIVWSKTNRHL